MNQSQASLTALISAFGRVHHAKNDSNRIFDDSLAEQLFASEELVGVGQMLAGAIGVVDPEAAATKPDGQTALALVMRAQSTPITLSRARYTEDLLEKAVRGGVGQYVILGAGYDTIAHRRLDLMRTLRVFELDHPATQAEKLRRIERAGWAKTEGLEYVAVDLAAESLPDAMGRSTYDPQVPAFFSWLGVTYYLTRETVFGTLRSVASLACAGSMVVFDYVDPDAFDPAKASVRMQRMQFMVQRSGEPLKTGLDPETLASDLGGVGLRLTEELGPASIQARYFEGRDDGYRAFEHVHFAAAVAG